jgi:two-component system chemotaxis response regulator CheB
MSPPPFRVLVVDDTALYRKILTEAAAEVPGLEVIAAVPSGPAALARLASTPCDLLLLDVFMPEMDGPEVLARVRRDFPRVTVVMVSGATGADAAITVDALANGALDFIPKPQTSSFAEGMARLRGQLVHIVRLMRLRRSASPGQPAPAAAAAPTPSSTPPTPAPPPAPRSRGLPPVSPELIVIGVSTGGPRALQDLLPRIPADFKLPIVIVQHMPPLFTRTLAEQLGKIGPLPVTEAGDGEPVLPGRVLLAPGGRHLELVREPDGSLRTRLTDAPPVNSCRPAVDVLFQSVARCAPRGIVSVILTGMGEDGAAGVASLKASTPTWSLVQDEATCVIYGMPLAVVRRGLDDEVLPLPAIAPRLAELARARR